MHDIDTLLERLREHAVYSDKVTLPIPLYEATRRILKEIQDDNQRELMLLERYLANRGLKLK
jgi:hypothetical protein